jgi:hypothetical protein
MASYQAGAFFSVDPSSIGPGQAFPPTGSKVEVKISLPELEDCRDQPAGASAATLGGMPAWRVETTEPNDFGLTADSYSSYFSGNCFLLTAYFGAENHDQSTFGLLIHSFAFAASN